jgi:hypothetical protein
MYFGIRDILCCFVILPWFGSSFFGKSNKKIQVPGHCSIFLISEAVCKDETSSKYQFGHWFRDPFLEFLDAPSVASEMIFVEITVIQSNASQYT